MCGSPFSTAALSEGMLCPVRYSVWPVQVEHALPCHPTQGSGQPECTAEPGVSDTQWTCGKNCPWDICQCSDCAQEAQQAARAAQRAAEDLMANARELSAANDKERFMLGQARLIALPSRQNGTAAAHCWLVLPACLCASLIRVCPPPAACQCTAWPSAA